jgi:phage-related protein
LTGALQGREFAIHSASSCLKWHILPWRADEQTDACRRRSQNGALGQETSKEDLSALPDEARRRVGRALWDAQIGLKAPFAKPLKGFGGAGVLEVVDDFDGNAYRSVYTVRFAGVVYVLHAFQKKSTRGISTPKSVRELIARRLAKARQDYESWRNSHGSR